MTLVVFLIPHSVLGSELNYEAVSYTHLRAHETVLDIVCRLLLEKKKMKMQEYHDVTLSRNQSLESNTPEQMAMGVQ